LAIFLWNLVPWPSIDIHRKFHGDHPRGTPPSGELNTREVAKYSDFGPIEDYISETVQGRRYHTTTVLRPFFRDHQGEAVPEENFWTLRCKGRLTEAVILTIWLGTTPSGLTSAHLHHPPYFLQAGCPFCRPTNSVKALKATR